MGHPGLSKILERKMLIRPQIVLLKEGTDTSQGTGQLLSNITACSLIVDTLKTTLGPRGMDKLIVGEDGQMTISNDGATIVKLLDVVHPAARVLVDIARAQDAEVGDGTTSVILLAGELLNAAKPFVEEGLSPRLILQTYRQARDLAVQFVRQLAIPLEDLIVNCSSSTKPDSSNETEKEGRTHDDAVKELTANEIPREVLEKCAATSMNSKLIANDKDYFKKLVVDAVLCTAEEPQAEKLVGIKKIQGGSLTDSFLVSGVAFDKTFSYAGFEQQPKHFDDPAVLCLNLELELKAEKDNAEVRIGTVQDYQAIVDAEWAVLFDKLHRIHDSGAKIVLSRLPIGDVATQFFADRGIFCAGRVPADDLERTVAAVGGSVQTSVQDLDPVKHLGRCVRFDETLIGSKRVNVFTGGLKQSRTCTLILRGGSEQFLAEVERSLHDALMVVRRTLKHRKIVGGGGSTEMQVAKHLREHSMSIAGKAQMLMAAFARAFEAIPRQLCDNAGIDANDLLTQLRKVHAMSQKSACWMGIDLASESVGDMLQLGVWEPVLVKENMISAAVEAACMILSIDLTLKPPEQSSDASKNSDFAQMAARANRH
jgi:T-complex protein 1 subunit eta